ncbi:MAG: hypothetical protein ACXWV2_09185, partial [Chitinophagaceae bacterium]
INLKKDNRLILIQKIMTAKLRFPARFVHDVYPAPGKYHICSVNAVKVTATNSIFHKIVNNYSKGGSHNSF